MQSTIIRTCLTAALLFIGNAFAADMPPLAEKLNCTTCHAIDRRVVGPAWRDVSMRYTSRVVKTFVYKGKEYPLLEGLVMKISNGGSGNWGSMPMPANDLHGNKREDIAILVKYILDLSK